MVVYKYFLTYLYKSLITDWHDISFTNIYFVIENIAKNAAIKTKTEQRKKYIIKPY